jgi:hypothetical protein
MVKAGDVLLTFGGTSLSKVIAGLSGGSFSHAAIFVSPLDLFESYDLVAHTSIEPVGQATINGKKVYLAVFPHNPVRAELWRHPEAESISWERFQEVYARILKDQWGFDYPPYAHLVPLALLPDFVKEYAKDLFKNYPKSPIPGDFCSKLVARFYDHLGLRLFDEIREVDSVGPNDLTNSKLVQVKGAVLRRGEIVDFRPQPGEFGAAKPGLRTGIDSRSAGGQGRGWVSKIKEIAPANLRRQRA